jgi:RNA polymerase sigma-70 factor (ECF subfamily)
MAGAVDEADDLLQDALLRAWRGLSSYEGTASLRTWLYRVTTSACIDRLRHQKVRRRAAAVPRAAPPPPPHLCAAAAPDCPRHAPLPPLLPRPRRWWRPSAST